MKKWMGLGIVLFAMTLGACSQKAEAPAEQPAAATEKQFTFGQRLGFANLKEGIICSDKKIL